MTTLPDRAGLPQAERAVQQAWRERYAKDVQELVVHREVASPKLTLIVISYKAQDYLIECLQHLRGQTAAGEVPYEILLADSGGIEHLRSRTAALCDVDLRLTDGIPLNAARNAAMAWARGEYVAIIDDDGLVAPTFVEVACKVFEDPKIAAMRGRIVAKEHPYFCTLAGHYDRGDDLRDDVLATEGHMVVRRGIYFGSGGFPDDAYGGEGLYLAYRITRTFPGMRVVYAPDLLMRHDFCDSWDNFVWKMRKYHITSVADLLPEPDYLEYVNAYRRSDKGERALSAELWAAREFMKAARWVVRKLPAWAVPKA